MNTEKSARESADSTLTTADATEKSARESADTTIKGEVKTEKEARESADATEKSSRETADNERVKGPASATEADIAVYNGVTGKIVQDGGKTVAQVLERANHTGTQLAATISNFDTQVRTSTLNQMTAPTADLSVNSHKLTSVSEPTASTDAATKKYVDATPGGFGRSRWRPEGTKVENVPRVLGEMKNSAILTSGTLLLAGGLELLAGVEYKELHFYSATTKGESLTHQWVVLTDINRKVLARSTDLTTAAWEANSKKTFTLEAAYTPTEGQAAYAGLLVTATVVPTLMAKESINSFPLNQAPNVGGNSNTGLTVPSGLAVGATCTAISGTTRVAYCTVN